MAIITLTTDWGIKDYYVSAVKGTILSIYPQAHIVDVSHMVPPFDILQASFILKNSYFNFPKGTVHVIGVNTLVGEETRYLIVFAKGHYFVGADNGIFSLIFDEAPQKIVELKRHESLTNITFPTKEILVQAACHIAQGKELDILGHEVSSYLERTLLRPVVEDSLIRGSVIYIDSYKNIITNITQPLFEKVGYGRPFTIFFRKFEYNITSISQSYSDVFEGEKVALFSSTGYLEIAIHQGKASGLLGLDMGDTVRVEFHDEKTSH
jgi:S-adenosylmethionine hydrolase